MNPKLTLFGGRSVNDLPGPDAKSSLSFDTPPVQRNYQPNAPGVLKLVETMREKGYDGGAMLQKYNEAASKGPAYARETAQKIETLAGDFGFDPSMLWDSPAIRRERKSGVVTPQAIERAVQKDEAAKVEDHSLWSSLAKAAVNIIPETPQALLRSASAEFMKLGTLAKFAQPTTAIFPGSNTITQDDLQNVISNPVSDAISTVIGAFDPQMAGSVFGKGHKENAASRKLNDWVDKTANFFSNYKFDLPARRENMFTKRDANGDWHIDVDGEGLAQAVGSAFGQLGLMAATRKLPTLAMGRAIRAAEAVGDVTRAAELKGQRAIAQQGVAFLSSLAPQLESTYQSAYQATGDREYALSFSSKISPLIAAMDAFAGAGGMINRSGRQELSSRAVQAALEGLPRELTREAFTTAGKKAMSAFGETLRRVGVAAAKGGLEEGGTETIQEALQIGAEIASDKSRGTNEFGNTLESGLNRLGTSFVAGLAVGGPIGAIVHRSGEYQPTAFEALHEAYKADGEAGLAQQFGQLQKGLDLQTDMSPEHRAELETNLRQMAGVITSLRQPYTNNTTEATALRQAAYNIYDLNYRQIPRETSILQDHQDRIAALEGDNPVRLSAQDDGRLYRNPDGSLSLDGEGLPLGDRIDPAVAALERQRLETLLPFQQQRLVYLREQNAKQAATGRPIAEKSWRDGYNAIGSVQLGDAVASRDANQPIQGTAVALSANGQIVTIEAPAREGEQPVRKEIPIGKVSVNPAIVADSPQANPQPAIAAIPVEEGYLPTTGDHVYFANNPVPQRLDEVYTEEDGITYATYTGQNGETQYVPLDGPEAVKVTGRFDPIEGERQAERQQREQEIAAEKVKLAKKLAPGLPKMYEDLDNDTIVSRIQQLLVENNPRAADKLNYLSLVAEQRGLTVPDPTAIGEDELIERVSDADYEAIMVTGIIPDAVMEQLGNDFYLNRDKDGLSPRQQELLDQLMEPGNEDEAMRFVSLLQYIETEKAGLALNNEDAIKTLSEPASTQDTQSVTQPAATATGDSATDTSTGQPAADAPAVGTLSQPAMEQAGGATQNAGNPASDNSAEGSGATQPGAGELPVGTASPSEAPVVSEKRKKVMKLVGPISLSRAATELGVPADRSLRDLLDSMVVAEQLQVLPSEKGDLWLSNGVTQPVISRPVTLPTAPNLPAPPPPISASKVRITKANSSGERTVKWGERTIATAVRDAESGMMSVTLADGTTAIAETDAEARTMAMNAYDAKRLADHAREVESISNDYERKLERAKARQAAQEADASEEAAKLALTSPPVETTDEDIEIEDIPDPSPAPAKKAAQNGDVTFLAPSDGRPVPARVVAADGDTVVVQYTNRSGKLDTIAKTMEQLTNAVTNSPLTAADIKGMNVPSLGQETPAQMKTRELTTFKGQRVMVIDAAGRSTIGIVKFENGTPVIENNTFTIFPVERKGDGFAILKDKAKSFPLATRVSIPTQSQMDDKLGAPKSRRQAADAASVAAGATALKNMTDRVRKAFPRIRVSILSSQQMQEAGLGTDRGVVQNGVVIQNGETATLDTPIHEFGHILNTVNKVYFPNLHRVGTELIANSAYTEEVLADPEYQDLTPEGVLDEALARGYADRGIRLSSQSKIARFGAWLGITIRRIGEKLGMNISPETKLRDFLDEQARRLLDGQIVSDITSEQLAELDGSTRRQAAVVAKLVLPETMDEAYMRDQQPGATPGGRETLATMMTRVDENGNYEVYAPDEAAEVLAIDDTAKKTKTKTGSVTRFVGSRLEPRLLLRAIFGDTDTYRDHMALINYQQGLASQLGYRQMEFFEQMWSRLKQGSSYRNATPLDQIVRQPINAIDSDGNVTTYNVPLDVLMRIAGMFRSSIMEHGYVDHNHDAKRERGQDWSADFAIINPIDNEEIIVTLDKNELRRIEQQVFEEDEEMSSIMAAWKDYSDAVFPTLDRVKTTVSGQSLKQSPYYFPVSGFREDDGSRSKGFSPTVDDASILKERTGPPLIFDARRGMVDSVDGYNRAAHSFVESAPVWHNLDSLLTRQIKTLKNNPQTAELIKPLTDMRNRLADAMTSHDMDFDTTVGFLNNLSPSKLLQRATTVRFAFNIAIPAKQVTSYVSALDGSVIDTGFLLRQGLSYLTDIGKCYVLSARGNREGYGVGDWTWAEETSFDRQKDEIRALAEAGDRNAAIILERIQTEVHPDVQTSDWLNGGLRAQIVSGVSGFVREYGMAASRRADAAVMYTFFNAAKAQVAEQNSDLSPEEQSALATQKTVDLFYKVNQTLSRTDRSASQLEPDPFRQLINMYQSQAIKVMNTVLEKAMDVDLAESADAKSAARLQMSKTLVLNALINPALIAGIDYGAQAIRNIPLGDDDKAKEQDETTAWVGRILETMMNTIPGGLGALLGDAVNVFAQNHADRGIFPSFFETPQAIVDATKASAALMTKEYRREEDFQRESIKVGQGLIRAVGPITGIVPNEFSRVAANSLNRLNPPQRARRAARKSPQGIEYFGRMLGLDEGN